MKKPKITPDKPASKATTEVEKPIAAPATKAPAKKTSAQKKSPKKTQTVASKPAVATPEIAISERVGLTAGSIWHYLAENGAIPVSKLVKALPEEEKIIQRSIGWLAQEGKITIETVSRVETISLK